MKAFRFPALFILLVPLMRCAPSWVPPRGEPMRVGRVMNEELHLREIPLERYVAGVLEAEVHKSWPLEALKAQAVAARTYALYRKERPRDGRFDVMADTSDQVFDGDERHSKSIVRAVLATEGETLQSGGKIFQAFFHSCCGGISERADRVWPGAHPEPLLQVHEDPYCSACPPAHWEFRISRGELEARLREGGHEVPPDWKLAVTARDESGRAEMIALEAAERNKRKTRSFTISGADFRAIVGFADLKSTLFEIVGNGEDIVFVGRGAGHGVGLCQWGAKAMAERGMSYRDILSFYYPGAEVVGLSAEGTDSPRDVSSTTEDETEEKILEDLESSETQSGSQP